MINLFSLKQLFNHADSKYSFCYSIATASFSVYPTSDMHICYVIYLLMAKWYNLRQLNLFLNILLAESSKIIWGQSFLLATSFPENFIGAFSKFRAALVLTFPCSKVFKGFMLLWKWDINFSVRNAWPLSERKTSFKVCCPLSPNSHAPGQWEDSTFPKHTSSTPLTQLSSSSFT